MCNTAVDVKLDGLFKPRIFLAFRREVKLRSSSNLKQRFAALLKKFKVNEEEVLGGVDQVNIDRATLRLIIDSLYRSLQLMEGYVIDPRRVDNNNDNINTVTTIQ